MVWINVAQDRALYNSCKLFNEPSATISGEFLDSNCATWLLEKVGISLIVSQRVIKLFS
jgi:hypothetical protein